MDEQSPTNPQPIERHHFSERAVFQILQRYKSYWWDRSLRVRVERPGVHEKIIHQLVSGLTIQDDCGLVTRTPLN